MIKINRPAKPPSILTGKGRKATEKLERDHDESPTEFESGARRHEFDREIYGANSVKSALWIAQHGKCCFCESKISHISFGDVEHFRPKAGAAQNPGDTITLPGYFWLAYEWTNLLLCCQVCNQRAKKNYFPLTNPRKRARSHLDDLSEEKPLFINPADDDPERHIAFRGEYLFALRGNQRGATTIQFLDLNREALVEKRRDRLEFLKCLTVCMRVIESVLRHRRRMPVDSTFTNEIAEVTTKIEKCLAPSEEYSSMAKTFFGC